MGKREFVHTHAHSDDSILDSIIDVNEIAKTVAERGMDTCAITNHGHVMGVVPFYKACKEHGVKPILGCEFYVARRSHLEQHDPAGGNPCDHLILLAQNEQGYKNILRMVTIAYTKGYHHFPRIDLDILSQHNEGLIGQTACLSGGFARISGGWEAYSPRLRTKVALPGSIDAGIAYATRLNDILGKDNFLIEIQAHRGQFQDDRVVKWQKAVIEAAYEAHRRTGIELVATQDFHFKNPEDAMARELAFRLGRGKSIDAAAIENITHAGELYIKSPDEMYKAFDLLPDDKPLKNTLWVAERCNVELELGTPRFARFREGDHEVSDTRLSEIWHEMLARGLEIKYGTAPTQDVLDRLKYEKEVIERMGYVPYFLIVADFIGYARRNGIPVGPGRGSAGGSIVSYILGITEVDPIRFNTLFERFLNPDRISLPDIDVDFCKDRIGEVVAYIGEKYGQDRVAHIMTHGYLWARSVVREVWKANELPDDEVDAIANAIPRSQGEFRISISDALDTIPELKAINESDDPKHQIFVQQVKALEGVKRSISTHACGVIIGDDDLAKYSALMNSGRAGSDILQSQLDMHSAEALGLIKFDFLALAMLTIIANSERMIQRRHGVDVSKIYERDFDDPKVFDLLKSGQVLGIFQIEASGMREMIMRVEPEHINDIVANVALYRPGPLDYVDESGYNMADQYVLRKHGSIPITYLHHSFEDILKETYGVIVYQEQIIRLTKALCGYTGAEADLLRKAIGKKLPEIVQKEKAKFVEAAINHSGVTQELAEKIWGQVETFSRYGFNLSHAVAYSIITYRSAWLMAHYPLEFTCALLTNAAGAVGDSGEGKGKTKKTEDVVKYVDNALRMGIKTLEPDIQKSQNEFVPEDDSIRFGFCGILGVGNAGDKIIAARRDAGGAFASFQDLVGRLTSYGVTTIVVESLVYAGACDVFGDRNAMLDNIKSTSKHSKEMAGQENRPILVDLSQDLYTDRPMTEAQKDGNSVEYLGLYRRMDG